MKRVLMLSLMLLSLIAEVEASHAQGTEKDQNKAEKVYAIQNRIYHRFHELDLSCAYMADEDFFYSFPVGIGYSYHLNDHFGWEVIRGQWIFTGEKDIKKTLEDDFGLTPSEFSRPRYMLHSHLLIKPFYGKEAIWNKSILNRETYFLLGGGAINYKKEFTYRESKSEYALSLSLGVGTKYFISESLCVNIELRDLVNFREDNVDNRIYLGASFGFRFNLRPREVAGDGKVEKAQRYLEK